MNGYVRILEVLNIQKWWSELTNICMYVIVFNLVKYKI